MKATTRDSIAEAVSQTRDLWHSVADGDDIAVKYARDRTSAAISRIGLAEGHEQMESAIAACVVACNVWVEIARLAREQAEQRNRELVTA